MTLFGNDGEVMQIALGRPTSPRPIEQTTNGNAVQPPGQIESDNPESIAETAAILRHMSPRGSLGLPPLLEQRRWEWGITDGAFQQVATFERIFVHRIPAAGETGETYDGGKIIRPSMTVDREEQQSSRGVLVSAGLRAMDILYSNGIDLGSIVRVINNAIYGIPVEMVGGKRRWLLVLNDGDICGSEDLAQLLKSRTVGVRRIDFEDKPSEHAITGRGNALTPWVSDDQ